MFRALYSELHLSHVCSAEDRKVVSNPNPNSFWRKRADACTSSDALTTASAHLRGRAGLSPLFRASARHRQRARSAASAGASKAAETRAAPLVLPRPPPQPTRRGSALTKHGARRVGRHTRGPAYPDIDIGASQTDSALMRGTAAGEGPARPRRCQCPRLKRIATRDVFV